MFKTAIEYLRTYLSHRTDALNNKKRTRWFTQGVSTLGKFHKVGGIFGRDEENKAWAAGFSDKENKMPVGKSSALRLKIHFLAGCARDLCTLYSSTSSCRVRQRADVDRAAFHRAGFQRLRLDEFDQTVTKMEG